MCSLHVEVYLKRSESHEVRVAVRCFLANSHQPPFNANGHSVSDGKVFHGGAIPSGKVLQVPAQVEAIPSARLSSGPISVHWPLAGGPISEQWLFSARGDNLICKATSFFSLMHHTCQAGAGVEIEQIMGFNCIDSMCILLQERGQCVLQIQIIVEKYKS